MTASREYGGFGMLLPGFYYDAIAQKKGLVGKDSEKRSIWTKLKADERIDHCPIFENFTNLALLDSH